MRKLLFIGGASEKETRGCRHITPWLKLIPKFSYKSDFMAISFWPNIYVAGATLSISIWLDRSFCSDWTFLLMQKSARFSCNWFLWMGVVCILWIDCNKTISCVQTLLPFCIQFLQEKSLKIDRFTKTRRRSYVWNLAQCLMHYLQNYYQLFAVVEICCSQQLCRIDKTTQAIYGWWFLRFSSSIVLVCCANLPLRRYAVTVAFFSKSIRHKNV